MIIKPSAIVAPGHPDRIEDFYTFRLDSQREYLIADVGDWANQLSGGPYGFPALARDRDEPEDTKYGGGLIGAFIARKTLQKSGNSGWSLIDEINAAIRERGYERIGVQNYREQRALTFTGYIARVVANPERTLVTAVGDVRVAVDGEVIAGRTKNIDEHVPQVRRHYILEHGETLEAIKEAYLKASKPAMINQYSWQNTPGHAFSYPAIDGTNTSPNEGVQVVDVPTPRKLLMWSDGYPANPDVFSVAGLEAKLRQVYEEDPYRYKKYPAVGYPLDDRTALEIDFSGGFDKIEVSHPNIRSPKEFYKEL